MPSIITLRVRPTTKGRHRAPGLPLIGPRRLHLAAGIATLAARAATLTPSTTPQETPR